MDKLNLIAFDADDLAVISAHLQDAVVKVGDLAYLPGQRRFAAVMRRFDWTAEAVASGKQRRGAGLRKQAALRFDLVRKARLTGIDLARKTDVLALLAVGFEPAGADDPAGVVTLTFSGGAAIRLDVECIEAELRDLGPAWRARRRPDHDQSKE